MSESPWRLSWRPDPAAMALADRHYNRQKIGAPQFVPPGACFVLRTADRSAVWVTSNPIAQYVQHAWAGAWVNSLFRNEGSHRSSDLITWAVAHTRAEWPRVPELWFQRTCTWCGVPVAARTDDPDVIVACLACDPSDLPLSTGAEDTAVIPKRQEG